MFFRLFEAENLCFQHVCQDLVIQFEDDILLVDFQLVCLAITQVLPPDQVPLMLRNEKQVPVSTVMVC